MQGDQQSMTLLQVEAGHWHGLDDAQLSQAFDWPQLQNGQTTALLLDWRRGPHMDRDAQRLTARRVLQQVLAAHLEVDPAFVIVERQAGQVPGWRVDGSAHPASGSSKDIGISLSHDAGCSLLALRPHARLGVDLLRKRAWTGMLDVASLYLGPAALQRCQDAMLAGPDLLECQFASEWTRHEASLKCQGLALTEWHPGLARHTEVCTFALVESWVASVAWRDDPGAPSQDLSENTARSSI